ncbi:hypothetical protein DAI22_12g086350 [Oryza sativa Japonica Group]|nr:hypothetical protein DAI22_12g086350 [Oryza sativa Japonica Group]
MQHPKIPSHLHHKALLPSHLHHKPLLPWTRAKLASLPEESEAATVGEPLEATRRY